MIFWLAFIGCVVFAFLVGLVFGYYMRQNTKVGTPSASHNSSMLQGPCHIVSQRQHAANRYTP